MISCHEAKQYISQKLDGELTELENKLLEEHLSLCTECNAYEKNLLDLHNNLFKLKNIELTESIVDKLFIENNELKKKSENKKRLMDKFKPWQGLVAAAILIGIAIPTYNYVNKDQIYSLEQEARNYAGESSEYYLFDTEVADSADAENQQAKDDGTKENTSNGNEIGIMGIEATNMNLYNIEQVENQLIISQEESIIYKTTEWEQGLNAQWEIINENEIIYSLFDKDNNLVEKYKINLLEKKEEKINN